MLLLMGDILTELGLKVFNRRLGILFEIVLKFVQNGLDFLSKFVEIWRDASLNKVFF